MGSRHVRCPVCDWCSSGSVPAKGQCPECGNLLPRASFSSGNGFALLAFLCSLPGLMVRAARGLARIWSDMAWSVRRVSDAIGRWVRLVADFPSRTACRVGTWAGNLRLAFLNLAPVRALQSLNRLLHSGGWRGALAKAAVGAAGVLLLLVIVALLN